MADGEIRGSRAAKTRDALLRSGEREFSERGFHSSSVSGICERAGLANGTFYRHFANKVEIFAALVEQLQQGLCQCLHLAAEEEERADAALLRAYRSALAYIERETNLYLVGRSAESMQMGIHRHFRSGLANALEGIVSRGIQNGHVRPIDPKLAAFFILGVIEFASMRYITWEPGALSESVLQTFDAFLLRGIDSGAPVTTATGESAKRRTSDSERDPKPEGGEATRQALLASAEQLFGQAGFHETAISGITYLAGVAQGTFYLHFPSKVAVFTELVREVNRRFRSEEHTALAGLVDRRSMEREGFRTFFRFIGEHRGAYRLLREAEFVDPKTGRWYYERLAEGYIRGLTGGMARGEIRPLAVEPLAYALLGVGHSVALWALTNGGDKVDSLVTEATLQGVLDILLHGLAFPLA